jgi:hypothetical protein
MAQFSDEEIRRYARQMVLPEIGGAGQARLRAAHAVARDEVEALYLAGAGIGSLTVPTREIAESVRAMNPLVRIEVQASEPEGADIATQSMRALAMLKETLGL